MGSFLILWWFLSLWCLFNLWSFFSLRDNRCFLSNYRCLLWLWHFNRFFIFNFLFSVWFFLRFLFGFRCFFSCLLWFFCFWFHFSLILFYSITTFTNSSSTFSINTAIFCWIALALIFRAAFRIAWLNGFLFDLMLSVHFTTTKIYLL